MKTHTLCIKWSKPIRNVEILKSTKRLIFQNRKYFLSFFFQHLESFGEGRKESSVYLSNALGKKWKQAKKLANPGFFKEQKSGKLIFKQAS